MGKRRDALQRAKIASQTWEFITQAENDRFRYERQWYVNGAFYDNQHYVYYDRITGQLEKITPVEGQIYRSVPKTTRQIDSMVNMATSSDLRWVVKPPATLGIDREKGDEWASKVSEFLQDVFRKLKISDKLSEMLLAGFKYPVAYLWPGYDSSTGKFYCDVYDAFDIYFDKPNIKDIQEAGMIAKCFTKSIEELQADPQYTNTEDLTPDGRLAISDTKDAQEKEKYPGGNHTAAGTIRCAEVWKKVFANENGRKVTRMEVHTVAGDTVIREAETVEQDYFPPVEYKARPGQLYQTAWIELFISLNKTIDSLASGLEMYTKLLAKPRLLVQENQEIRVVDTPAAQLVKWSGGMPPDWMKPPPLPNELLSFLGWNEKGIEESGISNINMGQVPSQIKAAKAIETLKQADYVNLTSAMNGLRSTLSTLAQRYILLAHEYQTQPYPVTPSKGDMFFMASQATQDHYAQRAELLPPGTTILDPCCEVEVETDSGFAYTQEGKRAELKELFSMKAIDAETLLEGYNISNISEILQRVQEAKGTSMVDTEDFALLPPEIQKAALEYLASVSPPDGSEGGEIDGEVFPGQMEQPSGADGQA